MTSMLQSYLTTARLCASRCRNLSTTAAIPTIRHRFPYKIALASSAAALTWKVSDDAQWFANSFQRTWRAAWWAVESAVAYKHAGLITGKEGDKYNELLAAVHANCAQELLHVCKTNGGIYIKAGQLLTTFGAVPKQYQEVLSQLQDRADPIPAYEILHVIEEDLGKPAEKIFKEFSLEATAAASIAQVHKATLKSGQQVAVKVQYPTVRATATADLATFQFLSDVAAWVFPEYQLQWVVSELKYKLDRELDFQQEVGNAEKLRAVVGRGRKLVVPEVHHALSSSRVITMEWVDGCKINDVGCLRKQQINPRQVGLDLLGAFAEMTYVHGLVHGDPHPGNILVRPKGRPRLLNWLLRGTLCQYEIVLLDHGSYLELDQLLRQQYSKLWCAFVVDDMVTARKVAREMAGDRVGDILPAVLTARARTREERKMLRQAAGINSFGDFTQLLADAPRGLVEALRITAVVRSIASVLGASLSDRLRINGMHAIKGINGSGASVREKTQDFVYKTHVRARLYGIRLLLRVRDTLTRLYAMMVYLVKDGDVLAT